LKIITKKVFSVVAGFVESYPLIFFIIDPLVLSIALMVNFILFYAGCDKIFEYYENKFENKETEDKIQLTNNIKAFNGINLMSEDKKEIEVES